MNQYGNLFFLLQTEPRHIANLCRLVSLTEIDTLLQTVMFTLYGNQYESREEHLLLTMFQVSFYILSERNLNFFIEFSFSCSLFYQHNLKPQMTSIPSFEQIHLYHV
jgi:hypothetical protein